MILPACGSHSDATGNEDTLLEFTAHPSDMRAGQTATFTARITDKQTPPHVIDGEIRYTLGFDDDVYASIEPTTGAVTALTPIPGNASSVEITVWAVAQDEDAADVSVKVTIRTRVDQIALTPTSFSVTVGDQHTFAAPVTTLAAGGPQTAPTYAWLSSSPTILSVDAAGKITGLAPTPANTPAMITVSAEGIVSNQIAVTVNAVSNVPATMTLTAVPATGTVGIGATRQYSIEVRNQAGAVLPQFTTAAWSITTGITIASINATTGLATCNAIGTSNVHAVGPATAQGINLTADAPLQCVSLGNIAATIVLTPWTLTTGVNGTVTTTATFLDAAGAPTANGCPLSFLMDASPIASVTSSGLVATATGKAAGTTTLRAFCSSGLNISALARMQVTQAPLNVASVLLSVSIYLAASSTLNNSFDFSTFASAKDALGATIAGAPITWAISGNPNVSISATGAVTVVPSAVAGYRGSALVTASSGGQSDIGWVTFGDAGTIRGLVTSTLGQYIGGATATATNSVTGAVTTSGIGNNGRFVLTGLAPGTYNVILTGTAVGQTAQSFNGIVITAGQTLVVTPVPWP
ncbi:MAG TPA: carboxypeptidase regulatory-like domain-containing protein [Gemmatimonadaceae bacterium]|nr:carboxypeptidase regulatory-like domain-containing protein [Gemmatimonadaceae bacterium]